MIQNKIENIIKNKDAIVGIIGLGYVGLPLALRFSKVGFKTFGFDIDVKKTKKLNDGKSYISHISDDSILNASKKGFKALSKFNKVKDMDVIIICVPTPINDDKNPDLSFIKNTMKCISSFLRKNQLLILESTTYPGATEEEIVGFIEKMNKSIKTTENKFSFGKNFFIGYSPEREDPGNKNFSIRNIPKIVSGHTARCSLVTQLLYDKITDETHLVSSTKVAEMVKVLENTYRLINIGLVNELKMIADKMNIDIYEVIEGASTKPFGFQTHYPGPGIGGHCIPIDPYFLSWKANQYGVDAKFIKLAGEINLKMIDYVMEKVLKCLELFNKSAKNSRILILGLSYKKNIDDLRESPSLKLISRLMKKNIFVDYSDPYFSRIPKIRKYNFNLESVEINSKTIKSYDVIVLMTDHKIFNYSLIKKNAKAIIDTRGKYKLDKNIFRA